MPKSAQEHLFGAYHFGVVSLRGTFYLLIVPLPHGDMQRGGHSGGRPFLGLFCFLHNAGPERDPLFASCATQDPKKTLFLLPAQRRARKRPPFCFLHNAGLRKTPFFAPCVAQEAKKVSFPAAERRFTKPEIGFVISAADSERHLTHAIAPLCPFSFPRLLLPLIWIKVWVRRFFMMEQATAGWHRA